MRAPIRGRPRRGGIYFRLLVLLAALGSLAALAWMLLLPVWITHEIHARTGFDARVASLACNPFTGRLTIRGLVLANPAQFPLGDFVQLRELRAVGDLRSLLSGPVTLDELVLDVRRLVLVRRADGRSNAGLFAQNLGLMAAQPSGPIPPAIPAAPPAPARKFLLRHFTLRFDQLTLADYTGPSPDVHDYRLMLDQQYENVTDSKQLLVPDVLRRVAAGNLGPGLGRLVPGELGRALGDAARQAAVSGEALLKDAGGQATDLLRGLRERLEESRKP
jgi:hypothetical protein